MNTRATHSEYEIKAVEAISGQRYVGMMRIDGNILVPVFAHADHAAIKAEKLLARLNEGEE